MASIIKTKLKKKEVQEQLLLLYMIEKGINILEYYDLNKTKETLTKIVSIGCNSLLLNFQISKAMIQQLIEFFINENRLFFDQREIFYYPLRYDEKFASMQYEESDEYLNFCFEPFFDYNLSSNPFIEGKDKIDILLSTSEQYKSFLLQSGLQLTNTVVLNQFGKEQILISTWDALHDDFFDLIYEKLSNTDNTMFVDIQETFFRSLELMAILPRTSKYDIRIWRNQDEE